MNRTTRKSPATKSTGVRMHQVSLALAPGILVMAWQYGLGVIWNMLWLVVLCSMVEVISTSLRHGFKLSMMQARREYFGLTDGTTILAALLMEFACHPLCRRLF